MGIRINRVYTRTGDDGLTGLAGGERISKSALRVEAYGSVDQLNSTLGLLKVKIPAELPELPPVIELIQHELFDLGGVLATSPDKLVKSPLTDDSVAYLESLCDRFGKDLPELRSFILPGGSELAAMFHIARTECRRAERVIVALSERSPAEGHSEVQPQILRYLNRLSDVFFNLARWTLDRQGIAVPLWVRAEDRRRP